MKKTTYYQIVGALYAEGFSRESLILAKATKAKKSWLDKIVVNPKTGNKVQVRNLPDDLKEKYRPKKEPKPTEDAKPGSKLSREDLETDHKAIQELKKKTIEHYDAMYAKPISEAKTEEEKARREKEKKADIKLALTELVKREKEIDKALHPLKGKKIDKERLKKQKEEPKVGNKPKKSKPENSGNSPDPKEQPDDVVDISIFNKRPSELEDKDFFDFLLELKEKSGL